MNQTLRRVRNTLKYSSRRVANVFGLDMSNDGERVVIDYGQLDPDKMDMYERAHYERYLFAQRRIVKGDDVADMACGTGYGTLLLGERANSACGYDINAKVINHIRQRYMGMSNVTFANEDLLKVNEVDRFDKIVSFETIEHLPADRTRELLVVFYRALKPGGELILSTPFMQPASEAARKMGFHLVFNIDEKAVSAWLTAAGFRLTNDFSYQNYETFEISRDLTRRDFIIGIATK